MTPIRHLAALLLLTPIAIAQVPGDTCADPIQVSGPGSFPWSFAGTTSSGFVGADPINCAPALIDVAPHNDVFFVWTATGSGTRQFHVRTLQPEAAVSVHQGSDCSATCVASFNDAPGELGPTMISLQVTVGDTYLVQAGTWFEEAFFDGPNTLDVVAPGAAGILTARATLDCGLPNEGRIRGGVPPLFDADFLMLDVNTQLMEGFGIFLVAPTQAGPTPMLALGEGMLCLMPPVGRYSPSMAAARGNPALNSLCRLAGPILENVAGTDAGGWGFEVPSELPFLGPVQTIQPGDSFSFQFWYRDQDANGAPTTNLSNVLIATFE